MIHGDRSQSQRTALSRASLPAVIAFSLRLMLPHAASTSTTSRTSSTTICPMRRTTSFTASAALAAPVRRALPQRSSLPQERHDARKLERELKIKFEWREADKNLEKEVRNAPLDTTAQGQDFMQLETRSGRATTPSHR